MSEPISGAGAAVLLTAAGVVQFMTGEAGIVWAAFAGSAVFMLTSHDAPAWQRILCMLLSFPLGISFADFAAHALAHLIPGVDTVPASVGAAVAAACAVGLLKFFAHKSETGDINLPTGGGQS